MNTNHFYKPEEAVGPDFTRQGFWLPVDLPLSHHTVQSELANCKASPYPVSFRVGGTDLSIRICYILVL